MAHNRILGHTTRHINATGAHCPLGQTTAHNRAQRHTAEYWGTQRGAPTPQRYTVVHLVRNIWKSTNQVCLHNVYLHMSNSVGNFTKVTIWCFWQHGPHSTHWTPAYLDHCDQKHSTWICVEHQISFSTCLICTWGHSDLFHLFFSAYEGHTKFLSVFQSDIQTVLWRFIDWLALEHKIKYGLRSALAGVKSTLRVRESNLDTKYVYSFYSHCATYLIDCTDERQSWVLEGHWCSVLGDWLPLDLNSFIFSRLLSFLLFNLSFALPQLFCLYQTPTGIWPLLTRSAKRFETGWWKINC